MFLPLSDDHRIVLFLLLVALFVALVWWRNHRAKKWLMDRGRVEKLPDPVQRLAGDPRRRAATRLRYSEQEFQEMVASALDEVPEEFDREWKNVAVIVSTDWPAEEDRKKLEIGDDDLLLGTYSGVARTEGARSDGGPHV